MLHLSPFNFAMFRQRILGSIPEAEFLAKSRQKSEEFSSLLFTVTSGALFWDLYIWIRLLFSFCTLYNVQCTGESRKAWYKPIPPSLWFRKSRNFKSENSQDYAQKPHLKLSVHEFGFRDVVALALAVKRSNHSNRLLISSNCKSEVQPYSIIQEIYNFNHLTAPSPLLIDAVCR